MNANTRAVIQATFEASNKGEIHFGDLIGRLMSVQVESYHVDYRSGRTTFYLPDGTTLDCDFEPPARRLQKASTAIRCARPSWARNRGG
jgi:hypothetical protein